jgi:hypothetical protein
MTQIEFIPPNPKKRADGTVIKIIMSWVFQKISDYWDQNEDAIYRYSSEIHEFDEEKKENVYSSIQFAIETVTESFSDKTMAAEAVFMTDHLYKALNRQFLFWGETTIRYLDASIGTFLNILSKRGFLIQYLVDNSFTPSIWGMMKPMKYYSDGFNAARFIYICPQKIAYELMKIDDMRSYFTLLPQYIKEARSVANNLIKKCHETQKHYVLLDTDYEPELFQTAKSVSSNPLVITIFRNEAPVKNSNINLTGVNREGTPFFKET